MVLELEGNSDKLEGPNTHKDEEEEEEEEEEETEEEDEVLASVGNLLIVARNRK